MKENPIRWLPGFPALLVLLALLLAPAWLLVTGIGADPDAGVAAAPHIAAGVLLATVSAFLLFGLYMVEPYQAAVVSLFGKYVGTVKDNGLRWNNPVFSKKTVSQRVRNFESGRLKVDALDRSPIEIAAVIVWRVVDSAEAVYNVDDYESFVHIQSEAAIRAMANACPYDQHEDDTISLRSHSLEISERLEHHLDERLTVAGVDLIDARISHLAYAPEIARRCCSASRPTPWSQPARASCSVR